MIKNQRRAVQFALVTVVLWSTVATAFKIALESAIVQQVVVIASSISLIVLAILYRYSDNKRSLWQEFSAHPVKYLLSGAINPVLYYLLLFGAYDRLPAQIAQPINYTWAIVLALLAAPILDHKLTKSDGLGLLFCYAGVVILVTRLDFATGNSFDLFGLCLVILSTVFWSVYWLINAKTQATAITSIFLCFLCASPWLLIMTLYFWQDFYFSTGNVLASIYIGLFEMSLSFVFWLKAMNYATSTAQISSLVYLSPFLSLFFISQFVGEEIYPTTVLALFVICLGLIIQKRLGAETRKPSES